jgi:hypothetical protein
MRVPPAADRVGSDTLPLAWVRIGIGVLFLVRTTPALRFIDPTLGADAVPLLGWPHAGASSALGLGLRAPALEALCVLRTLGLVSLTLGIGAPLGALLAVTTGYIVMFQAPFAFTATQHLLLQATFLLGIVDSSTVLALRPMPARSPRSSVWLLRGFVTSVYAWAASAKLRLDWLDGRTLALFHGEGRLHGPLANWLLATPQRCAIAGPAIAFAELSLTPLLLVRKTRVVGLALAVAFHVGIEWMARPDVIGWAMLCLLLVFVDIPRKPQADVARQELDHLPQVSEG